jgi:hypothetical protein
MTPQQWLELLAERAHTRLFSISSRPLQSCAILLCSKSRGEGHDERVEGLRARPDSSLGALTGVLLSCAPRDWSRDRQHHLRGVRAAGEQDTAARGTWQRGMPGCPRGSRLLSRLQLRSRIAPRTTRQRMVARSERGRSQEERSSTIRASALTSTPIVRSTRRRYGRLPCVPSGASEARAPVGLESPSGEMELSHITDTARRASTRRSLPDQTEMAWMISTGSMRAASATWTATSARDDAASPPRQSAC